MSEEKKSRLRQMLRLSIIKDKSFEELFSMRFNLITLFFVMGAMTILLIAGVIWLIAFTNLREYIPGYPTGEERRMIVSNMERADSLLMEVQLRDAVLKSMREAISGKLPIEAFKQDSVREVKQVQVSLSDKISEADSLFRAGVESEERYNVNDSEASTDTRLEMTYFYPPLKGVLTSKFGEKEGHMGIDIAGVEGARVSSILDGTVIFAEWTVETGYVIEIQHDNQTLSIYKHNGKLLKKVGMRVAGGEAIALVGNTGEFTTGSHLHFELWYSGVPLNPENYILFE